MRDDIKDNLKEIDDLFKQEILIDKKLHGLLEPFFSSEEERRGFVKKCLTKTKTRRMMLRLQWFSEVADDLEKIRANRPALKLIFIMAMAEGIAKQLPGKKVKQGLAVQKFFKCISSEDEKALRAGFRRAFISPKTSKLRFSSIIWILYDVRNKAVHGEDFWSFSFLGKNEKGDFIKDGYTDYGLMGTGYSHFPVTVEIYYYGHWQ